MIGINSGPGTVIWSIDKDMRTLPGLHVDLSTGDIIDIRRGRRASQLDDAGAHR